MPTDGRIEVLHRGGYEHFELTEEWRRGHRGPLLDHAYEDRRMSD